MKKIVYSFYFLIIFNLSIKKINAQGQLVHFNPIPNTGITRPVQINASTIDGNTLNAGDEIGLFDGALCVGAITYTGSFPIVLASILKIITPIDTLPGAIEGHPMIFKIWDKGSDIELHADPTYESGGLFGDFITIVTILEGNTGILGDVNADDIANSTDALIVLSCDVDMPIPPNFCPMNCGDVNEDGFINSTDALIILSYDVGMNVPFPVGEPGCPQGVTPCPGCNE